MITVSRTGMGQGEVVLGADNNLKGVVRLAMSDPHFPRAVYAFEVNGIEFVGWGTEGDIIKAAEKAVDVLLDT